MQIYGFHPLKRGALPWIQDWKQFLMLCSAVKLFAVIVFCIVLRSKIFAIKWVKLNFLFTVFFPLCWPVQQYMAEPCWKINTSVLVAYLREFLVNATVQYISCYQYKSNKALVPVWSHQAWHKGYSFAYLWFRALGLVVPNLIFNASDNLKHKWFLFKAIEQHFKHTKSLFLVCWSQLMWQLISFILNTFCSFSTFCNHSLLRLTNDWIIFSF